MHKPNPAAAFLFSGAFATPVSAGDSISVNDAPDKEHGAEIMHGVNVMLKRDMNNFTLVASGNDIRNINDSGGGYLKIYACYSVSRF
ncbi:hypothetical protein QLZ26_10160 [Cronobacter universalis]|uniref:hypothetical protein n=1 Tax=Cronobacter universalis TaxID=535744 RepID=UPI0024AEA5EB|nr:hypothetical protein [Cronobacter universalis]MDI7660466.1 hypothetical protein [Cronobacter universalis]